ncbi:hypothetical protein E2C01_043235 [Portunus trituberculatus]|uniref:Uncharacterized protein n=1 Tax=Portunus trituberculatus TaxID=210409 RepID=A0A5B7FV63_PORTR|nr:hypothetical protein [Portunus trituberculatus]
MKFNASLPLPSPRSTWAHTRFVRLFTQPTNLDSQVTTPPSARSPSRHTAPQPSPPPKLARLPPLTRPLPLLTHTHDSYPYPLHSA